MMKYLSTILISLFLLSCSLQKSSVLVNSTAPGDYYNFHSSFVNGTVFEWTIQNVESNISTYEFPLKNNDVLSVELEMDMNDGQFAPYTFNIL